MVIGDDDAGDSVQPLVPFSRPPRGAEACGRLADKLAGIKGRFILSLNDRPETRATFAAFDIETVTATYFAAARTRPRRASELIITCGGEA